jgi:hypothetical protein
VTAPAGPASAAVPTAAISNRGTLPDVRPCGLPPKTLP